MTAFPDERPHEGRRTGRRTKAAAAAAVLAVLAAADPSAVSTADGFLPFAAVAWGAGGARSPGAKYRPFGDGSIVSGPTTSLSALSELDRQAMYARRNHTWPPRSYNPPTPGWTSLFERRAAQLASVPDLTDRYNGWLSVVTSGIILDNFTEYGWGLTRAPDDLVSELRESLRSGMEGGRARLEHEIDIIETATDEGERGKGGDESETDLRPLFIDQPELNAKVLGELLPVHSSWSNVSLVGEIAYGLRIYRNRSSLLMHTDKPTTHIVASILHVDRSDDSDPWPLIIEDFDGNTHEVVMEPGDLLFYESAKVYHGRPKPLRGSWYCSLFCHYYPQGWDVENFHWESHYAVPPHWFEDGPTEGAGVGKDRECRGGGKLPRLEVVGTGVKEAGCEHGWSALRDTIKWHGPAKEGVVVSTRDHESFQARL